MKKVAIILIVLIPAISFNSCQEDELDEPANVELQINMIGPGNSGDPGKSTRNENDPVKGMRFTKGMLSVESIEFDGTRENAKNYFFTRSFQNGLIADLNNNELSEKVSFDIPQGSYYPAKITLFLNTIDSLSGFELHGAYHSPNFEETAIEFDFFEGREPLEITIQNEQGNKKVLIKKNQTKELKIQINITAIFATFNPKRLENAEVSHQGDNKKIIISKTHNQELYYEIVNRIEKTTKAILK